MNSLTDQVLEFARSWGASLVGIVGSGCVIQKPDGTLEKVSPEEADRYVGALGQSRQNLYI